MDCENGFDCARRIARWMTWEGDQQRALDDIDRAEAQWLAANPPSTAAAVKAAEIVRTCRTQND